MAGFNPYHTKATAKRLGEMTWFRLNPTTVARKALSTELDFALTVPSYPYPLLTANTFKEACSIDGLVVYVQATDGSGNAVALDYLKDKTILEAVPNHVDTRVTQLRLTNGKSVNVAQGQGLSALLLDSAELKMLKKRM